jgi:hypothetical protein
MASIQALTQSDLVCTVQQGLLHLPLPVHTPPEATEVEAFAVSDFAALSNHGYA